MTRAATMIGLLALLLTAPPGRADTLRNVKVGQATPAFEVATLLGKTLSSAALRGDVVVLVFVAAEQRSSERAAQAANAIAAEFRNRDLSVVFMTADVTRVAYFRQLRDWLGIHEPLGLDVARKVYGALGLFVLPTTIVIDADGRLAHVISSYKTDHEHVLRCYVRHALGLIDDAALEAQLASNPFQRRPNDRIARRRSAARLLRQSGLLAGAETELRAALEIDPDHADTKLDLASIFIVDERIDEAGTLVEEVMAANPGHRRGTLVSGVIAFHRGNLADAERILEKALLLNPDPIWTHYYLGLIRERQGDDAAAMEHFKEASTRLLETHPI